MSATQPAVTYRYLTRSRVYECLACYEDHRGEIDVLVARQGRRGIDRDRDYY